MGEWILDSAQKPPRAGRYLVYGDTDITPNGMFAIYYWNPGRRAWWKAAGQDDIETITHWMPLPERPQEE